MQQEALPPSVTCSAASVHATTASLAAHVTDVLLVIMVTQHAQHVAVTWQEQMLHSATRRRGCVTVSRPGNAFAR